jgi:hypothetical protein
MGGSSSKPKEDNNKNYKSKYMNTDSRWNNIKTDKMSVTGATLASLSSDAKKLIASLNIPAITESYTSEFTVNHIMDQVNSNLNKEDQEKFHKILNEMSPAYASDNMSNTSPFITEEMYNNMINSETSDLDNNITMKGGAFKSRKDSTSSSSSTSSLEDLDSSSSSSSESDAHKKKKHHKKEKKHHTNMKHSKHSKNVSSEESERLSYVSSSAHTEGDFSESANNHSNRRSVTEQSVADENTMVSTSISVNTSDINMVSE